ncbi:MAG TPA: hypothetical protein VLK58_19575 [Conexibacter sp.]|nr:hypothetical protein [Conexibacter sp.]
MISRHIHQCCGQPCSSRIGGGDGRSDVGAVERPRERSAVSRQLHRRDRGDAAGGDRHTAVAESDRQRTRAVADDHAAQRDLRRAGAPQVAMALHAQRERAAAAAAHQLRRAHAAVRRRRGRLAAAVAAALPAGAGRSARLQERLEAGRLGGHHAVDAQVEQPAVDGVVLLRLVEPDVDRDARGVRLRDPLGRDDLELRSADRVGDRDLHRLRPGRRRRPAEQEAGDAVDAGSDVDPRRRLVEAVDGLLVEGDDDHVAAAGPLQVGGEQVADAQLLLLRLALDLDVDRDVGEGGEDLGERRDAEVVGLEAGRRPLLAGAHAAVRVGGRRPAGDGVLAGDEVVRGVEAAQLRERQRRDAALAVGRAVDRVVVDRDQLTVLRRVHVELDHVAALRQPVVVAEQGVRRRLVLAALMDLVQHPQAEPLVGCRARGGRQHAGRGRRDEQPEDVPSSCHLSISSGESDDGSVTVTARRGRQP